MFLQNSYIVHGRPAMEAKLVQSLVNHSGLFEDPLEYEVVGDDPEKPDYKVRAHATRKSTGTVLYGPWITWKIVKGEGWDSKSGSKWKTIPEVMFGYRAASWFCNRHCPEVKMGFMTGEEAEEVGARKPVNSVTLESTDGTRKKFGQKPTEHTQEVTEDAEPAKDVAKETTDDDGGTEAPQTDPQSAPGAQATAGNAAALTAPDAKDQDGAIDGSATTAESSSDEPQYMCKGCGVSPTKVNVRKVKGKDKFFCDACMSSKIAVIK
jgi:hypothetical protein